MNKSKVELYTISVGSVFIYTVNILSNNNKNTIHYNFFFKESQKYIYFYLYSKHCVAIHIAKNKNAMFCCILFFVFSFDYRFYGYI